MTDEHDHDEEFRDGCDLDFHQDAIDDEESDLFVLFVDALDPVTPKTVPEAAAEWKAIFP